MSQTPTTDTTEPVENEELIQDDDLQSLFDSEDGSPEAEGDLAADAGGTVHVPIPTPQIHIAGKGSTLPGEPSTDPLHDAAPISRPKINIQFGGATGASGKFAAGAGARSRASDKDGAVRLTLKALLRAPFWITGKVLYASADSALTALNCPFGWMKPNLRNLVGAVAVVTLITSTAAILLGPVFFPRFEARDLVAAIRPDALPPMDGSERAAYTEQAPARAQETASPSAGH